MSDRRIILRGRLVKRLGFTWVQLCPHLRLPHKPRHFWSVRGIARSHQFGPITVLTMRTDCVERALKAGLFER